MSTKVELPIEFVDRLKVQYPQYYHAILDALAEEAQTSIRLNPYKSLSPPSGSSPILWNRYGFVLASRPNFGLDPNFHNSRYYVQESSSMFIGYVLSYLQENYSFRNVMDMCAAPGGKSTLILDVLGEDQYLVSNEILPKRNVILKENLTKWGQPKYLITQSSPKDIGKLNKFFDVILVDAPCSGEGLFRKDKNAIKEWSPKHIKKCVLRQKDILTHAYNALSDGGLLIYSTCTFNPDENEKMINHLLELHSDAIQIDIPIDTFPEIVTVKYDRAIGYAFLPSKTPGEGFFCSLIQKGTPKKIDKIQNSKAYISPQVKQWIADNYTQHYSTYKFENTIKLVSNAVLDQLVMLQDKLYIKQLGADIADISSEKIQPSFGLSMLPHLPHDIPRVDVDIDTALNYLAKNNIAATLSEGYQLICYDGHALGWIEKKKGNEINHYPSAYKLRKF